PTTGDPSPGPPPRGAHRRDLARVVQSRSRAAGSQPPVWRATTPAGVRRYKRDEPCAARSTNTQYARKGTAMARRRQSAVSRLVRSTAGVGELVTIVREMSFDEL